MKIKAISSRRGFLQGMAVGGLAIGSTPTWAGTPAVVPAQKDKVIITEMDEALGNYPPYDADMPGGRQQQEESQSLDPQLPA